MPVKKRSLTVLKNARKSERRRIVNRARKLRLKRALKETRSFKTKAQAQESLPNVQSVIDKSVRQGLIHPNKAARLKSKLRLAVTKLA